MNSLFKHCAWSALAALALTGAAIALNRVTDVTAYFLLPGIFAGALFLSGGPHSDFPMAYFAIAATMNVILWFLLILGFWVLIERLRSSRAERVVR